MAHYDNMFYWAWIIITAAMMMGIPSKLIRAAATTLFILGAIIFQED